MSTTTPEAPRIVAAPFGVCAICGGLIAARTGVCAAHLAVADADWAARNRLMCDLLHRGKLPPGPPRIA